MWRTVLVSACSTTCRVVVEESSEPPPQPPSIAAPSRMGSNRRGLTARRALARQLSLDDVAQNVHDLARVAGRAERGAVHFLERMVEIAVVQGDDRLAERGGEAGVEGSVPLAVLVAEAHD